MTSTENSTATTGDQIIPLPQEETLEKILRGAVSQTRTSALEAAARLAEFVCSNRGQSELGMIVSTTILNLRDDLIARQPQLSDHQSSDNSATRK